MNIPEQVSDAPEFNTENLCNAREYAEGRERLTTNKFMRNIAHMMLKQELLKNITEQEISIDVKTPLFLNSRHHS